MAIELTNSDLKVFQSAYFGLKDISSQQFIESFNPILLRNAREIKEFSERCGYSKLFKDVNLALTLKPNNTLSYHPESNSLLINVWYFLFCGDNSSVIIKPPIYLLGGFIHEYNHQLFCQKHNMLYRDEQTTANFLNEFHTEIEVSAYSEEIEVLTKAKDMVKDHLQVRSFRVESWSENVIPTCKIENVTICPDMKLELDVMSCTSIIKQLTSISQRAFKKTMKQNKFQFYKEMACALKLDEPSLTSPIARWVYENRSS